MDQQDYQQVRERLEKLKEEILFIIEGDEDDSGSQDAVDEVDRATDMISREMGSFMSSNFRINLKRVQQALDKLDKGKYGMCEKCGGEIPIKRLEVLPFTESCIECQKRLEEEDED